MIAIVRDPRRGAAEQWRVAPRAFNLRAGTALRPDEVASRFSSPGGGAVAPTDSDADTKTDTATPAAPSAGH